MSATEDEAASGDPRPCYRIAVFGLGERFQQLLDTVARHAGDNDYRYQITEPGGPGEFDIALVDMTAPGGADVARTLKSVPQPFPVIGVGRRSNRPSGNDDLLLATFSLDVLGVLNKAAQSLSTREGARRSSAGVPQPDGSLHLPYVAGRAPRTLVVEPSPSVRSEIAAALRQIGVDAEGVGTLAQAKDVLSMRTYELVILDPQQPDGDGLSMLRRLRHERGPRKLMMPVIVLSSRSGLVDLIKAAWSGCNGYLGKPVTVRNLHSTVSRVLLRSLRRRLDAQRKVREEAAIAHGDHPTVTGQPAPADRSVGTIPGQGNGPPPQAGRAAPTLQEALLPGEVGLHSDLESAFAGLRARQASRPADPKTLAPDPTGHAGNSRTEDASLRPKRENAGLNL